MSERGIDVTVDSLDEDEVPNPAQPWEVARRCIRTACAADEHDWVGLMGLSPTGYWRECRTCGIADVTAPLSARTSKRPTTTMKEHDQGSADAR